MYIEDFRRLMFDLGFKDIRTVSQTPITMSDPEVTKKIGQAQFSSVTFRAFNLDLEDRCEDYGQAAVYLGTIPNNENGFQLDDHHFFEPHKLMPVCGNTAAMLKDTRFQSHFQILGEGSIHYGLFGKENDPEAAEGKLTSGSCC